MLELTDKEKEEAHKTVDALMNYWWKQISAKMDKGLSFNAALQELIQEIRSDA